MKKVFNFKKELPLNENVSNITSISLDTTFSESNNSVEGTFVVEGTYKTHELSLNKKDFKYELNFCEEIENMCENTLNLEVEDFTYDVEDNNLIVDINYEVTYEENKIDEDFDEEEFERFLEDHEVDIVNLNDKEGQKEAELLEETPEVEEVCDDSLEIKEDEEDNIQDNTNQIEERNVNISSEKEENENAGDVILKTIDKEEKYITYHVYVCEEDDTFDSISEKFKTTKEEIREYNEIDDIEYGRKIIIPVKDE